MKEIHNRRSFIKTSTAGSLGLGLMTSSSIWAKTQSDENKRIGMIGLDTSHSVAFTKEFNHPEAEAEFGGYKVVAAYPRGSYEIESSYSRIPRYTKEVEGLGGIHTHSQNGRYKTGNYHQHFNNAVIYRRIDTRIDRQKE